ncbi:MAG: prenyltransferase/squalene oxidase repeat-containing protein [Solirubrobacterales bacterium]
MSWQAASLAIVVASLAGCFWWYERSRPSSKEVALVATMAALSALGRDAFAALPDVKPTTTMVLICGYAFGGGPGFAVGAVGALASNIFLGQGSWTPWQMLAWGAVGVAGSMLGRVLRRRALPRLTLALLCALAAEMFNLLIDLYSWSQGGAHTLSAYGAWIVSGLSFDATHVVASFLFGLTFGPALLRMLVRARSRLEIVWQPIPAAPLAIAATLVVVAGVFVGPGAARAASPAAASSAAASPAAASGVAATPARAPATGAEASIARLDVARETAFLAGAQNADGGFGAARGQSSSELYSGWAAMGLAASGRDPLSVRRDGRTVLDALRGEASSLNGAGDLERTILALHACGASVHLLAGGDPVAELLRSRERDGSFGHLTNITAFAVFALRAAGYSSGKPVVRAAGRWLARQQNSDGGFGFATRGGGSDVDDTAAALQALVDAGSSPGFAVNRAASFLIGAQNPDGGYPQQRGGDSNAQSTAWAIQGLLAAGRNVGAVRREGSRSPLGYLESLISPDGSVRYSRIGTQTPVWVTAQALTALAGKSFPIAPVPRRSSPSIARPRIPSRAARRGHRPASPLRTRAPSARAGPAGPIILGAQSGVDGLPREVDALIGVVLTRMLW